MAGNYMVRNTAPTRAFLDRWSEYWRQMPRGYSSSDNGALHLHLLREASLEAAVAAHPNAEQIPANNISKLESLGLAGIRQLLADDSQGASEPQSPLRESSQSPSEGDS